MRQIEKCLLCHSQKVNIKTSTQKGYQKPQLFTIYHCEDCNTSFSIPRVDTTLIYELIYKEPEKIGGYSRYVKYQKEIKGQTDPLKWLADQELIYWGPAYVLKEKIKLTKDSHILEVGSGLGYFSYALHRDGFTNIKGLDISAEAVENAKLFFGIDYICDDVFQYAKTNAGAYDIILLTEVIEHIEDPLSFLESLSLLLKPNGKIILTTPNRSFFPNNAIWNTDQPPVHCWWLGEESLSYMAQQLKMEVSFLDFTPYYDNHFRRLHKRAEWENVNGDYVFEEDGSLCVQECPKNNHKGIFPSFFKKTKLYKRLSTYLYPKLLKGIKASGAQADVLCAILTRQ